jgi:hypothetical protein
MWGQLIAGLLAIASYGGIFFVDLDKSAQEFALIVADVVALGDVFVYERNRPASAKKGGPAGRET